MNRCLQRLLPGLLAVLGLGAMAQQPSPSPAEPPPGLPPECLEQVPLPLPPDGRDRGLLWRIERAGRVSHLYGTVHVGRPNWATLGPKVREALAASDVLAVELDTSDPAVGLELLRALPPMAEPPPATAARMAAAALRECADPRRLAPLPPLLRAVTLSLLAANREGLGAEHGLESMLIKSARAAKLPVISLEDAATQIAALSPERPGDFELMLDGLLTQLENGEARSVLRRLVGAWERGDAADVADYARWCNCLTTEREQAWHARLNDARNPTLAQRIDALHSSGQRVFAAIGALHMSGPEGLPLLLARRGFTVQLVAWQ